MTLLRHTLVAITLSLLAQPTWAQITVLDNAQAMWPRPPLRGPPAAPSRFPLPA
jgi:hypothetical protein